jgi:ATP-dependent Clp protease ATP-binding subunit ClpA
MHYFSKTQIPTLSTLMLIITVCLPSNAATPTSRFGVTQVDTPICYVEMPGRSMMRLDALCGQNRMRPDHLPDAIKQFTAAMSQAKNTQEYATAQQQFQNRLPYSNQVKKLQSQQRNLVQQLNSSTSPEQRQEKLRQFREIQQKLHQDPTYNKVQQEIRKVYQTLIS